MNFKQRLISIFFGLNMLFSMAASVQWVDQIVVVVNQDVITQRDINDISNQIKAQLPKSELKKINVKQLAIDNLVQQKLLKQAAENMQLTVSDSEIDEQIKKLAKANKMTKEQFLKAIAKEGVPTSMLRKTIKDNLMVEKLTQEVSKEEIRATDSEIEALLNHNKMPLTEKNKQEATNFIIHSKQQEIISSIVQDLKNRAYIEYKEKPY